MFEYTIRRILLMIPTGLGITFMVFFILQVAPDGPFERAVRQIKQGNMGTGESGASLSGGLTGDSSDLTPELLEDLRMQYGLDKPIIIRYLIWLGAWPKEVKSKTVPIGKAFRETVDVLQFNTYKEYLLQRYVKVIKNMEGPVVPKQLNYSDVLPVAIEHNPVLSSRETSEKSFFGTVL